MAPANERNNMATKHGESAFEVFDMSGLKGSHLPVICCFSVEFVMFTKEYIESCSVDDDACV